MKNIFLFCAILLLGSCNSISKKTSGQNNQNRLNDIWVAVRIEGNPINRMVDVPRLEVNTLEMRINGTDGCNNYFGSISELTEHNITISGVGATKKMCANMEVPDRFNAALVQIATYEFKNNELILNDKKGKELLAFIKTD